MKKMLAGLVILLAIGGGVFFFLNGQKDSAATVDKNWNEYATDKRHLVTLNDRMATVAGGAHIAKFTVTLEFKNEQGYEKFMGHSHPLTEKEKAAAAESHGSGDEVHISPMNVKVNSVISDFMMNLGTTEAKKLTYIEEKLRDHLNERLGLEKDFVKAVYIEQYVFN